MEISEVCRLKKVKCIHWVLFTGSLTTFEQSRKTTERPPTRSEHDANKEKKNQLRDIIDLVGKDGTASVSFEK
jgi:hypothetical protein